MALSYSSGDPDYLKVVLLQNVLAVSLPVSREGRGGVPILNKLNDNLDIYKLSESSEGPISLVLDGDCLSSANEICRYLCIEVGCECFATAGSSCAAVDYWLEWEACKLKVENNDPAICTVEPLNNVHEFCPL